MQTHELSDRPNSNPISPKVSWPFVAGALILAIETAVTQSWDEANWVGSALIVVYALLGYFVTDPLRKS